MTEDDDAFIRTIVDNPGADLPRLVYADWLDDRDDPRGPFLRAEVEWAQPWKEGKRPDDATELRAMVAGLDPLWVARVARPPLGVCCDHLRFTNCGRRVSLSEVLEFEQNCGYGLPHAFKAFLLNYNAGQILPILPPPEQVLEVEGSPVICFSPMFHSYRALHEEIPKLVEGEGPHFALGLTKIGYNASTLSNLLLGITSENDGQIWAECFIQRELVFVDAVPDSAASLPEYFARIQPYWACARLHPYDI